MPFSIQNDVKPWGKLSAPFRLGDVPIDVARKTLFRDVKGSFLHAIRARVAEQNFLDFKSRFLDHGLNTLMLERTALLEIGSKYDLLESLQEAFKTLWDSGLRRPRFPQGPDQGHPERPQPSLWAHRHTRQQQGPSEPSGDVPASEGQP